MEKLTVSRYLETAFAQCGKSQVEVAKQIGYPRPNILSMFKNGTTKVPIDIIGPLADALGVDPGFFFALAMKEYKPETFAAIETHLAAGSMISAQEMKLIQLMREEFNGNEIDLTDPATESKVRRLMQELSVKQEAAEAAARERYAQSPANARNTG